MVLKIRNHADFQRVIAFINNYLHNATNNFTETEHQSFQNLITMITSKYNNDTLLTEEIYADAINCGDRIKDLAEFYAQYFHPYLALIVCVFGIFTNVSNIIVLTRKEMACTPINRILTSLAITEILLMIEYIPYVYYHHIVLPKRLDFPFPGAVFMLFHIHITQILHTTSICLTLLLAVWRFLALRYPSKKHILCSEFRCTLGITLSYLLPIVLCIPTYVTITITKQEITEDETKYILYHTDLSETFKTNKNLLRINFWIYAVFLKLLPCCLLTILNYWLIKTLFVTKKRKVVLRTYDCYALNERDKNETKRRVSKSEKRANCTTKMLVVVVFLFLITEFPQGIFALLIGLKGKEVFLECYQSYGELMDILALINGAVSFILYCSMNRMFRVTFGQLFKISLVTFA